MELSILCDCECVLLIFSGDKLYQYCSTATDDMLERYYNFLGPYESLTNKDLVSLKPGKPACYKLCNTKRKRVAITPKGLLPRTRPSEPDANPWALPDNPNSPGGNDDEEEEEEEETGEGVEGEGEQLLQTTLTNAIHNMFRGSTPDSFLSQSPTVSSSLQKQMNQLKTETHNLTDANTIPTSLSQTFQHMPGGSLTPLSGNFASSSSSSSSSASSTPKNNRSQFNATPSPRSANAPLTRSAAKEEAGRLSNYKSLSINIPNPTSSAMPSGGMGIGSLGQHELLGSPLRSGQVGSMLPNSALPLSAQQQELVNRLSLHSSAVATLIASQMDPDTVNQMMSTLPNSGTLPSGGLTNSLLSPTMFFTDSAQSPGIFGSFGDQAAGTPSQKSGGTKRLRQNQPLNSSNKRRSLRSATGSNSAAGTPVTGGRYSLRSGGTSQLSPFDSWSSNPLASPSTPSVTPGGLFGT
eukprot:CAMPEP_0175137000 /NCGR_PEP_ID=MMETSP0087-20121206/9578_1 /TAXON_ID=136419 /ORGANISM="Unknown Unknown, Strain D1" /LENGTH=465 /DNA_ID=CAMNT_0016419799 /DNA_START=126 /DNA_END=1523 /DNA_ORIENTATION=-